MSREVLRIALLCFVSYLAMYLLRKPWLAASYPNKVSLATAQIVGYFFGKLGGVGVVATLTRAQLRPMLLCIALASLVGWSCFAVASTFLAQALALALGTAPLAVCWSLIYRYVEGREGSEQIASTFAIAFVVGGGVAKALGALLLRAGLSSSTMPLVAGLVGAAPYAASVWLLSALPPPAAGDAEGGALTALGARQQLALLRSHWPGLAAVGLYFFCFSALRDLRDAFQAQRGIA
jgi:hypothetical protein